MTTATHDANRHTIYTDLLTQARGLMDGERDPIANAANLSALLYHALDDINWLGFYFLRDDMLIVGPFQGQPACVRIPVGSGVCGTAVAQNATQLVDDVHAFDGHIACDPRSRSEVVVPLRRNGQVFGALDVDSPIAARFDAVDRAGLEALALAYCEASDSL